MKNFSDARTAMVDSQLRPNKIRNPLILNAFATLPRESFVPPALVSLAYSDMDHLDKSFCMLRPLNQARLVDLVTPDRRDKILCISLSAYLPAILSSMAGTVVWVGHDVVKSFEPALSALEINNIQYSAGPLKKGMADKGPYDAIIIEGGIDILPQDITNQIKPGKPIVAFMRRADHLFKGVTVRDGIIFEHFEAIAPVLPGFERKPEFTFS